ncbi:MAG: hypothetical protein JW814_10825 [Candidatus Krumholzibacteriota bacterium]|nr:hypothetical protein [Candidatus Krumholzibacteriota bacterium]
MSSLFRNISRIRSLIFIPVIQVFLVLHAGCDNPGGKTPEKDFTLTADERYIVQLYVKINELEKNLQDNPSDSLKKWDTLKEGVDKERILRTIDSLKENPERWHAVFSRIELLIEREKP